MVTPAWSAQYQKHIYQLKALQSGPTVCNVILSCVFNLEIVVIQIRAHKILIRLNKLTNEQSNARVELLKLFGKFVSYLM